MLRKPLLIVTAFFVLVPLTSSCSVSARDSKTDLGEGQVANTIAGELASAELAEIKLLRAELQQSNQEVKTQLKELILKELLPELEMSQKRIKEGIEANPRDTKAARDKVRIGRIEWLKFKDPEFELQARVDSGAKTCSMHAENIKELQIKGEPYVQFEALDQDGKRYTIVRRVVSRTKVKGTTGVANVRYVIRSTIKLGNSLHDVNVNLNDRTRLNYNFLIGRNLLMGNYLVDVSESHLLGDKL